MRIYLAMAHQQDPEPPAGEDRRNPEVKPVSPEEAPSADSAEGEITAEQLARVVRRMESGFYDRAEIRDEIARRLLDDLDR
jgi:hypothetical protein